MDATAVLPTPSPAPTSARNAPDVEADSSAEEFASHLPRDEPARPDARRPAEDRVEARTAHDQERETEAAAPTAKVDDPPTDIASLSSLQAPVVVRPQNSIVTFDLSALVAAPTPTPATTPDSPAMAPGLAQQSAPASAAAARAAPSTADLTAPVAVSEAPTQQTVQAAPETPADAQTATPAKPVEIASLADFAAAPVDVRPAPKLRAGRTDASGDTTTDGKPAAAISAAPAAAPNKAAAKIETTVAVQAASVSAPTREAGATTDGAALAEAAPAEARAQRLNEATGAHGHRATTPAALVAQHIVRRFDGRSTSIDVRLDPPELGRVQVSLDVSADNKVSAVVAAENPATLADLVRSARELERALQEAGLDLDSGGLSFDLADRGENEKGEGAADSARDPARADAGRDQPTRPASRPFGLESWRGARIDVMV